MGIETWNKKALKHLCHRIGDGLHGTPEYVEEGAIYFINGNNLKNGKIEITSDTKKVSSDVYATNYIGLDSNSLLLSINGTLGSMAFYNDETIMLGKSAAYLNFKTGINRFYYYYFQLENVQNCFYNLATGSTIKNLGLKSIQDFEVPIPDDREWKKIAKVLSDLDAKIELNSKINAELEAMAKLIYDYWFVQFDFPISKEQAEAMGKPELEGKPYKSSGGKMVWNAELRRDVPEGWEVKELGELVNIKNGRDHKHLGKGKIPVFGSGGVMRYADKSIFEGESILIPRKGSLGNLFYINEPFWCVDTIFYTQMKHNQSCKYLFYTIQNFNLASMNTGTSVPSMTTQILNNLKLVFPPLMLLKKFDKVLTPMFKKKYKLEAENQKLAELRDWLLPMLMNGQVVSTTLNNREREYEAKESKMNVAAEPCVEYAKGE